MLPKRLRLPRAGFAAQAAGKRLISSHFSLTSAPALPKMGGVAVVISAKTMLRAVDRHRLKRRALAVLRPFAAPGRALILRPRAGALALPAPTFRAELRDLARGLNAR